MKSVKTLALLFTSVALVACGGADQAMPANEAEMQQQMAMAAQVGQAQAIAQIIERSMAEPCQPVNLFNNQDEENPKEVNLINIACDSLDLPELVPAATENQSAPAEAPTTTE